MHSSHVQSEANEITAYQLSFPIHDRLVTHSVEFPVGVLAEQIRSQLWQHLLISPFIPRNIQGDDIPYPQEASTSHQEYC